MRICLIRPHLRLYWKLQYNRRYAMLSLSSGYEDSGALRTCVLAGPFTIEASSMTAGVDALLQCEAGVDVKEKLLTLGTRRLYRRRWSATRAALLVALYDRVWSHRDVGLRALPGDYVPAIDAEEDIFGRAL